MGQESDLCRTRAAQCRADADASTLENVRERHLRAEAAWVEMAERAEGTDKMRASRVAEGKPPLG